MFYSVAEKSFHTVLPRLMGNNNCWCVSSLETLAGHTCWWSINPRHM